MALWRRQPSRSAKSELEPAESSTSVPLQHRTLTANGIRMHIAEEGAGPLVLLCHGFPEGWYSWRHQLPALAAKGYRAVAPDMRGYGQTDAPLDMASYDLLTLVGDLVALVAGLGEKQAILVGHDWGANVAWHAGLMRPDVFPALGILSVPYRLRGPRPPLTLLREAGLHGHYWFYLQDPGVAESHFEADARAALRRIFYTVSGDAPRDRPGLILEPGRGWLDNTLDPDRLPSWLTDVDLDHMTAEFVRAGFRGGMNWYRNIDRNWHLTSPWAGTLVRLPVLFIVGSEDPVLTLSTSRPAYDALQATVPGLKRNIVVQGAGHFIQQERPHLVNEALIDYLADLPAWGNS
jgi:pimeloyl-ACP methyl ester carboxylesterase